MKNQQQWPQGEETFSSTFFIGTEAIVWAIVLLLISAGIFYYFFTKKKK